jgi:phage tail-like protein
VTQDQRSSYLQYLPAIFQDNAFLGRFLMAFETLLSQAPPAMPPAVEQVIDQGYRFYRPYDPDDPTRQTPAEFLPWLAGWVSLSLREDWDDATRRQFLREIVPLYRQRGTKAGLLRMLEIYVKESITIYDTPADFGFDPPAHFFQVEIRIKDRDPVVLRRKQMIAMAIIEQEKPAHTFYAVQVLMPTMQLLSEETAKKTGGEQIVLGKNSVLGTQSLNT